MAHPFYADNGESPLFHSPALGYRGWWCVGSSIRSRGYLSATVFPSVMIRVQPLMLTVGLVSAFFTFGIRSECAPNKVQSSDKPLEVKGQSRNLNLLMTLKNGNDEIGFVSPRKTYQIEITHTHY